MEPSARTTYVRYRLLEMVPGILVWSTFAIVIVLTVLAPSAAVVFIVGFDLVWLLRILYSVSLLVVAYRRYHVAVRTPWHERVAARADAGRIRHAVIIATYGEDEAVLRGNLEGLRRSTTSLGRLVVVIGTEGRESGRIRPIAARLTQDYGGVFGFLLISEHPEGLPGELAGKGANIAYAGERLVEELQRKGIDVADVLVTTLDVDTVVHPEYFAYLTIRYLDAPNRERVSYQPIPVFANNLWQSPLPARIVSMGTTFWLLAETVRPERLFTFSSHSMPLSSLIAVGFWQRDIVTEDSRIFVQGLLHYDGDYRVEPLYLPVSMDAVHAGGIRATLGALYRQQRRWAYGVENFPFMAWNFAHAPAIRWTTKFRYLWNQLEGVYSWATVPIVIVALGWIPLRLATVAGTTSAFLQTAPVVLHWILTISLIGLAVCAGLTLGVVRPAGAAPQLRSILTTILAWALFPVAMVLFGSIPATDAVTRLMFGHYLGFSVTRKYRPGNGGGPATPPSNPPKTPARTIEPGRAAAPS